MKHKFETDLMQVFNVKRRTHVPRESKKCDGCDCGATLKDHELAGPLFVFVYNPRFQRILGVHY